MDKKTTLRLSIVFGLIYFFSTNGLAKISDLTLKFMLKDTLGLTPSQQAYFGAVMLLGWGIKPLWGLISDARPIFGYRRKPYLILTSGIAAIIWLYLGQMASYTVPALLTLFAFSACVYAFNDVVTDGLMVQTGKPHNLTARFQSVQWGAVYIASIGTGLASGWIAEHWAPQSVFQLSAVFPLVVLGAAIFLVSEEKSDNHREQFRATIAALQEAARNKILWLVAFFLFFWNFSPSAGTPFLNYATDNLGFSKMFWGVVIAVGSAGAFVGSFFFNRYAAEFETKKLIHFAIIFSIIAKLSDLMYFAPFVANHLWLAKFIYAGSAVVLGAIGAFVFLTLLNLSAILCPKYSEGTTFAALMSFWNIGQMGSEAFGGWLFGQIGLQPLILVSAVFAALTWCIVPYLNLEHAKQ